MKTGAHEVVVGGAPTRVVAYPGDLLTEAVIGFNVTNEKGVLFSWPSVGFHFVDIAMMPPNVEVALISNDGKILEIHDPAEEAFEPVYPYVSAVLMPRGWFDKHCISSRCCMNLD